MLEQLVIYYKVFNCNAWLLQGKSNFLNFVQKQVATKTDAEVYELKNNFERGNLRRKGMEKRLL